jgi:uncharacterized protein YegL
MPARPGSTLAQRPLHFFVLADCSGSMAADGKLQALNTAMRETIPHLVDVARQNPHARVLVRVITFSTGASWHVAEPTPVEHFEWSDLAEPQGYTDLGAAIELLSAQLRVPPMEERALPPAAVLISDGMPTDDYKLAMGRLLDQRWGQRTVRMAVGIGRDADPEALQRFIGPGDIAPVSAHNPEQLVRMIRWASIHATKAASQAIPQKRFGPVPRSVDTLTPSELTWG